MEKIKINLPQTVIFRTTFTITGEDINEADHLGNERILHHANIIRHRFLEELNLLPPDARHGFIIANHSIQYRSEGFLKEVIVCEAGVANPTECSFDLILHFVHDSTRKSMAIVRSGLVYFDYTHHKIRHLPAAFEKLFG